MRKTLPMIGADVPSAITMPVMASRSAPVNTMDSRLSAVGALAGTGRSRQRHASRPKPSTPIEPIHTSSWLYSPRSTKEWTETSPSTPERVRNVE